MLDVNSIPEGFGIEVLYNLATVRLSVTLPC